MENEVHEIKTKNKENVSKLEELLKNVKKQEGKYDGLTVQQDEEKLDIELFKKFVGLKDKINTKKLNLENLYKSNDIVNWDVEVGPSKKQFIKDEKPENHYNITEDNFIPILKNHKYLIPEKQEENFKKLIEFKIT
ncbi:hypothetical protein [Spiroplasma sp. AdecLV25b]|uniref:hypothetical protein n=1 Tax=Spiroplasma sp. AdecLV25b TaxID=3027162 RepID=UPI0027E07103|nr:hypothetical protein [Spiroplasma sp. AdecLV25b]